jgi:tRNA dimethylallyltransferase
VSDETNELLVVVGPTASGKTSYAIELAERLGGEIVSADSVQVYRYFDIGTGKPSLEELARARHHLVDILEPEEPLDAARWATLAETVINDIRARGKVPIVCGGSFLWVRALVYGLAPAPPADQAIRERHRLVVEASGRAELHKQLSAIDAETAARLSENDFVRVSRALEVFELTGVPMSQWQREHGFRTERHKARMVGIRRSKEELDLRIRARIESMFEMGWLDEARDLLARGYGNSRAFGCVGYKQIAEALTQGESFDERELLEKVYRTTRVFARRQRTWLRDQPVEWLAPNP